MVLSKEQIEKLVKDYPLHYVVKLKKTYNETWNTIEDFNKTVFSDCCSQQKMYNYLNCITEIPGCMICGNPVSFDRSVFGYRKTCSHKCGRILSAQNEDTEYKQTVSNKRKNTNIKKYGVKNVMQKKEFKDLQEHTMLERYGVKKALNSPELIEKAKNTTFSNYGVTNVMQSEKIKEKVREKCLDKYGVSNPAMISDFKLKSKNTRLYRYGKYNSEKALDNIKTIVEHRVDISYEKCNNECGNGREQEELFNYISGIAPDAVFNTRNVLKSGKELDVYIPSKNLAIEYNGLYWHCERRIGKTYHLNKTKEAEEQGIRLIHIFSDEWNNKKRICKNKFKYLVSGNLIKPVYARKCTVKKINRELACKFLDKYHIQGSDNSSVYYGLYYKRFLVAVCGFFKASIQNRENGWILSRYATIFSRRIVGGLGKILKYFCDEAGHGFIRTFADIRISQGKMYESLGFSNVYTYGPIYWYTKDFTTRHHRFGFRKDKIKNKPEMFYDDSLSEHELAIKNGFYRIYDCGQKVYEKEF